jgi:hypothetical protein
MEGKSDKRNENKNTSTKIKMTLHPTSSSKFSATLIDYIDRYQHLKYYCSLVEGMVLHVYRVCNNDKQLN